MAITLEQVETLIQALLDDPQVDYQEGDIQVSAGQKIKQLMEFRRQLINNPAAEIAFINFEQDFDEFGISQAEIQS